MTRASRLLYAVLAWAFLVGLVVQVFAIGLALFSDPATIEVHRTLGWILHLAPLLILLFAYLARAGRSHWQWALALTVVVFVTPILPGLRTQMPAVAAFHPVFAVASFALAAVVAWNATQLLRNPAPEPTPDTTVSPA